MNVLFDFSNHPFVDDLSSQYARMALAISMENKVTLVYRKDAVVLSEQAIDVPMFEINYFEQERFLVEQGVDMYVLLDDMQDKESGIKNEVKRIDNLELKKLYKQQDVIFRN